MITLTLTVYAFHKILICLNFHPLELPKSRKYVLIIFLTLLNCNNNTYS